MIILWVRVITETADHLPQIVRSTLHSRCPGFLEDQRREQIDNLPIWKSLEAWVIARCFDRARAEGWIDALMYYAYKDLRTEQAWTTAEARPRQAGNSHRPSAHRAADRPAQARDGPTGRCGRPPASHPPHRPDW